MSITITVDGLTPLLRKLEGSSLYGKALRTAMEATRTYGEGELRRRAPRRTGRLQSAIRSSIDAHEVPLWASVEIPHLPLKGGFRYGGALEGGERYHYRSGTTTKTGKKTKRRLGKPTKGWWSGVRRMMASYLRGKLQKAVQEIEAGWGW